MTMIIPWYYKVAAALALLVGIFYVGNHRGYSVNEAKWQAIESARLLAAKDVKIEHQASAIGVLNHATETAPVFAAPAVAADRVRNTFCPSAKLPEPARPGAAAGPPSADTTADAQTDTGAAAQRLELVDEMRECLKLAHDYDTVVPLWHSQETK